MANYYTEFSFFIPLPEDPDKRKAIESEMRGWCDKREAEEDGSLGVEWNIENAGNDGDRPYIWCRHNDDYGNVDHAAEFTRAVLRLLGDPRAAVVIEWSNSCSKPRLDAYGGGACLVTAKHTSVMQTNAWAEKMIKRRGLRRVN